MKVYILGPHSSGKTTLARNISKLYNLPLLPEVARLVLAEKELQLDSLRTNMDVVNDYQSTVFNRQLQEEKKFEQFVSDRSFDCIAYSAQHSSILSSYRNNPELDYYIESLRNNDVILFFIRANKDTLKEDGVRETPVYDEVLKIDAMVKFMLEWFGLNYIPINTSNMQERLQIVNSVLRLMK